MVAILKFKGIQLKLDDPCIEAEMKASNDFYEWPLLRWIQKNIPAGGTWVDVGANFGNHTVFFLTQCSPNSVVSLEPVEANFALLRANIDANSHSPRSIPLMVGAGSRHDTFSYDPPHGDRRWSQVSLGVTGAISAVVIPIDSLHLEDVRVMKFDCEGMEWDAVIGAWRTIERDKPDLFIEIWEQQLLDQFSDMLGAIGYSLIERYGHAPVYHFSASGRYPTTYRPPIN